MYYVSKRLEISAAHSLTLSYESPCSRLHGHNWVITVYCKAEQLNKDGMVIDFKEIKERIHGKLDHQFLNDVVPMNPTAENLAKWICDQISSCYRVDIWESEGNCAIFVDPLEV
jgi:6-pyruvoyltetrahydropterin/6-carboxytetrahydropterin synthase